MKAEQLIEQEAGKCRVCGFAIGGELLIRLRRDGVHRNASHEPRSNDGVGYCPLCDDETLVAVINSAKCEVCHGEGSIDPKCNGGASCQCDDDFNHERTGCMACDSTGQRTVNTQS